jgi:hypothetical protein
LLWRVERIDTLRVRGGEHHSKYENSTHVKIPFARPLARQDLNPVGGHRRPNSLVSRSEPVPEICSITPNICWLEPKHGKSRQENIYFGSHLLLQLLDGKGTFGVRKFLSLSPNFVYTFTNATCHGANDRDVIFRPSLR